MHLGDGVYFYRSAEEGLGFDGGIIQSNTVVIDGREPLVIDPGHAVRWSLLKDLMGADGLKAHRLKHALFTHCHHDHTSAGEFMAGENEAEFFLHPAELDFIETEDGREDLDPRSPWAAGRLKPIPAGPFSFGGHEFVIIHSPGHSPGGLCLHWPDKKLLITGDLYFPGTIGAFTYPGGEARAMFESVAAIQKLKDVETVICGHGPALVGRAEIENNYARLNREIALKKRQAAKLMDEKAGR